jgi:hypothetical protein
MSGVAAPFRFLIFVIGGWTAGRAAFLLPGLGALSGGTAVAVAGLVVVGPLAMEAAEPPALPAPAANITVALDAPAVPRGAGEITIALDEPSSRPSPEAQAEWRLASNEIIPAPPPAVPRPPSPQPGFDILPPAASPSRWSGSAWLFARPDQGRTGLAAGGQLGGSQTGVRLAYRLTDLGPGSVALAGRVSTPLRSAKGAEAAVGIDWYPVKKLPFRLSVERRVEIGREGRNAWSAYAAGGFYRGGLPGGLELNGYGQAGVVGARSRDLFADGAVRVGKPLALSGGKRLVIGAGAWGAAQPGASRLDIGPRAALSVPVAGATVTGAIDWRIRVTGDAEPGSGAAFTLAADF